MRSDCGKFLFFGNTWGGSAAQPSRTLPRVNRLIVSTQTAPGLPARNHVTLNTAAPSCPISCHPEPAEGSKLPGGSRGSGSDASTQSILSLPMVSAWHSHENSIALRKPQGNCTIESGYRGHNWVGRSHVALSLPKGLKSSSSARLRVVKVVPGIDLRCFGFAQHDIQLKRDCPGGNPGQLANALHKL